ncbi:MAG: flagellar hook capping protein [gamma proteobacterium symbiont of Clathrolucina costata]|uniref:Basal-body rod modification protein FlgD n=1 Tax=Candidatus Thiodiazotropha taylori TaxID=2792791 RepID=A0A9E4TRU1_9GAMM|nr:flagellar hook capping protein [Candidatus Thiodiazotropha taylori]MCW4235172.1 flagellar hook capping protein [Candidatus Thiodiazotropha endolucinida]
MVESIGAALGNESQQIQRAGLGQEDFLKILLTQLTYQDPMKPLDNQEFIAQFAQFANLDQTRQSNENLDALLFMQMADQGVGLLGKSVEVRTETGSVVGDITAVAFSQGIPLFTVKVGEEQFLTNITLSQVVLVR